MSTSKGAPYFFNTQSKVSAWEAPTQLSAKEIEKLPGAHYLHSAGLGAEHVDQVKASHLLVKHSGSRRPSSWKEVCMD